MKSPKEQRYAEDWFPLLPLRYFQQRTRPIAGHQDHSQPKIEQTPWRFVTDRRIGNYQEDGVKRQKTREANVSRLKLTLEQNGEYPDQPKHKNKSLAPNAPL